MHLHLTNGDAAALLIRQLVGDEPVVPWRDVLHEGPVPAGLDLEALSTVRAGFIAERGWADDPATVRRAFAERDAVMARLERCARVTLWFEHDLHDQLQLLQILDLVGRCPAIVPRTGLIQADRYLGALSLTELAALRAAERPVSPAQLGLAARAWAAFRGATPEVLAAMLEGNLADLPRLRPALRRLLAELPAPGSGLGRTESLALEALVPAALPFAALFHAVGLREPSQFMGDMPFAFRLERLAAGPAPLVEGLPPTGFDLHRLGEPGLGHLAIAEAGRRVLAGEEDWLALAPADRWLGGTRLVGGTAWRWDGTTLREG